MDAAEFVPGQWDKPKQAAVASEMIANGSQHSLSGLTDEDSMVQGSDANAAGWTAADYSQQYYLAQVSFTLGPLCCSAALNCPACSCKSKVARLMQYSHWLNFLHGKYRVGHGASSTSSMGSLGMTSLDCTAGTPLLR